MRRFRITDYMRPDEALRAIGVEPEDVTDIAISHAHWDQARMIELAGARERVVPGHDDPR